MLIAIVCMGSTVVRVMNSHSCARALNPSQGNHISDESSAEMVLYLCK